MQENIVTVVEKQNEWGELKTDSIRLIDVDGQIAHTVTCREGALCVQHCNLIIEVKKLSEAINIMPDGTCRTIKSQYQNNTVQNFESQGSFGATEVVNVEKFGNVGDSNTQGRSVYNIDAISPTLCAGMDHGKTMPFIVEKTSVDAVIGSMQENAMVGNGDYSPSLTSAMGMGGGQTPMVVEKTCVAMRGRNPEDPSDRTTGCPTEQRLEPNTTGCTNTLTTVQKDNLVLESQKIIYDDYNSAIPKDQDAIGTITQTCGVDALRNGKKIIETEHIVAYAEQNNAIREETFGTLTTDGSSPKHNNRVIKIKQATKQGFIECEVGGGMLFGLSNKRVETRPSNRERTSKPDADNGEYP